MDNIRIDITHNTSQALHDAISLFWQSDSVYDNAVTHYACRWIKEEYTYSGYKKCLNVTPTTPCTRDYISDKGGIYTLVLLLSGCSDDANTILGIAPLPYPLNLFNTVNFVEGWLNSGISGITHPLNPDFNGDTIKAWRVFNDNRTGYAAGFTDALLAVQPVLGILGK